jgi:SAM-dependent methyltransferase
VFVEPENYAGTFGFQWHLYGRTQLDHDDCHDSETQFRMKTGFIPEELSGKLILDVGCGMGRFAEVATRWGGRVVGIDLSTAAEVAAGNLADRNFVALQADVFALPFAPESFDYIYSIGVLHHTPNCEAAVKALPRYLKPGGSMAVWVYSAYHNWYRFADISRRVTSRMPARFLHRCLSVAVPVIYSTDRMLRALPGVGRPLSGILRNVLCVSHNPDAKKRLLDTFDWYSPKYQSKHTYEEVFRWFESCGLEDLHVVGVPVAVRGRKGLHRHKDGIGFA